ncbi:MAG: hypothetical protein WC788_08990 [Candidatus Paceibacterota bacterium]|jgi:peptide subunit release factor 1 (eRF1)
MARGKMNIERLTSKKIEELSKKRGKGEVFFSLYIGVRPGRNFVSEANSVISEEMQRIEKEGIYPANVIKGIRKISEKMKGGIRLLRIPAETRSIVMFCGIGSFGKFYHVPSYIPSRFVIGPDFYIHPLLEAVESHPKYLVVVLERDKARFFSFFLGEIEKISEIISSDVPQRIKAARGFRESNVQAHIEDHENKHLKKVCKETESYFKFGKKGYGHLVIGAHKEYAEKFRKILGERSQNALVGSYPIMPNYKIDEIKKRSQKVIEEHERSLEERLIDEIFNKSGDKNNLAVLGIGPVVDNFHFHNVETFVIGKNYKEAGYVCPKCRYISPYQKTCSNDKTEMTKVDDLADEIIEEAIANKIKIKHLIFSNEKFDQYGIGAILKTSK